MDNTNISTKWILTQFHHKNLTQIDGEKMHRNIKVSETELTENMITVWCPWVHGKVRLLLIQDITIYLQWNGANFDIPANKPLPYPVILPNTSAFNRKLIRAIKNSDNISLENLQASW